MKYDSFDKQLSDFLSAKINNKFTNRRTKQEIYRNGPYKIEVIIVNNYLEFWVNGIKFWNISPTGDFAFFGNIDFSNANVTGIGETEPPLP